MHWPRDTFSFRHAFVPNSEVAHHGHLGAMAYQSSAEHKCSRATVEEGRERAVQLHLLHPHGRTLRNRGDSPTPSSFPAPQCQAAAPRRGIAATPHRCEDALRRCVVQVCQTRPSLPAFANLRCGLWYVPSPAGTCYFKSTDGHTGNWSFSLIRLNLHVALQAASAGGCFVVDATRRGKTFPVRSPDLRPVLSSPPEEP